jgi:hypothetical protein
MMLPAIDEAIAVEPTIDCLLAELGLFDDTEVRTADMGRSGWAIALPVGAFETPPADNASDPLELGRSMEAARQARVAAARSSRGFRGARGTNNEY